MSYSLGVAYALCRILLVVCVCVCVCVYVCVCVCVCVWNCSGNRFLFFFCKQPLWPANLMHASPRPPSLYLSLSVSLSLSLYPNC